MLKQTLKSSLNYILGLFGLILTRKSSIDTYEHLTSEYESLFRSGADLAFLQAMPTDALKNLLSLASQSRSQIRQDLFVLAATNFKENGYFVEFGATDGISLNNTYLLEKNFSWTGILAEPARMWFPALRMNRNVELSSDCVWSNSGSEIEFVETSIPELSTALSYMDSDEHASSRIKNNSYRVRTISLNDLLVQKEAPMVIDYMSIDTEGSELLILSELNFSKWKFRVITVEHNFNEQRDAIHGLLTKNGYLRVCENISRFDDWYLNIELTETYRFRNV
jgi:FkbM family methyltransferase